MQTTITLATEDDLADVAVLNIIDHKEVYEEPITEEKSLEKIMGQFERGHHIRIARLGGHIIGYMFSREPDRYQLYIEWAFTDPTYRGLGIGGALMEDAITFAKSLGKEMIHTTVDANNHASIGLARKYGFEFADMLDGYDLILNL